MESFDTDADDKRSQQVLSTEIHQKVVEAFEVFDHENNKTVDVREIGTIVRSLGHCPSESQLQEIISDMEDAEQMGYIHVDRFLPVMSRYQQLEYSSISVIPFLGLFFNKSFFQLLMKICWQHSKLLTRRMLVILTKIN